MAHVTTSYSNSFSLVARIEAAFARFKEARTLRRKYNETVREMRQLSDRELNDIGISRYDIHFIAQEHVYG